MKARKWHSFLHLNRKDVDHAIRLSSLIVDVDGVIVKGFPSISVKKPSSILKIILERLGTSQDGDCERLCTSGDRRDFCAILGKEEAPIGVLFSFFTPKFAACCRLLDLRAGATRPNSLAHLPKIS